VDHAGRHVHEARFGDDQLFLIALRPEKEPDLGIEIVYTGGIRALEGKELVEVMGMGIVDLEPLPLKEGKILKPLSSVT